MTSMELVGLNTKWYRYQNNLTQEQYANKTKFKMAYISVIETGNANLTCKNIDFIANLMKKLLNLLKNYLLE
jgi:transcriptional regulator with XRE-family HTH domain